MLDKRFRRPLQSFLLVFPMTGIVTAINTCIAKGAGAVITVPTLERWFISCAVAFPCVIVMQPYVVRLTNRIVKS